VFIGFENAATKGKINLFAREGNSTWENRKLVAANMDLGKWYTIEVVVYPSAAAYEITVKWAGKRPDNPLVKVLLWPGLQLQRLTTNEPEDDMIEIAVAAMSLVVAREEVEAASTASSSAPVREPVPALD